MLLCTACLPGTLTRCFQVSVPVHRVKVTGFFRSPALPLSSNLNLILSKLFEPRLSEPAFETEIQESKILQSMLLAANVLIDPESSPLSPPLHKLPRPGLLLPLLPPTSLFSSLYSEILSESRSDSVNLLFKYLRWLFLMLRVKSNVPTLAYKKLHDQPQLSSSSSPITPCFSAAAPPALLFIVLQHAELIFFSGPLHVLLPLPGTCFYTHTHICRLASSLRSGLSSHVVLSLGSFQTEML